MVGIITNLQRFSTKDGPGIRSTVFLKGCNLKCLWCHNPETIEGAKELKHFADKCRKCGSCVEACPESALELADDGLRFSEPFSCTSCGVCIGACPFDALEMWGENPSPEGLVQTLLKDKDYYDDSGGGVTFSGGEPMLQKDFLLHCLKLLQEEGISTAVDTALSVPWEEIEQISPFCNIILVDVKGMNSDVHSRNTGVDTELIHSNILKLKALASSPAVHVRIPVIKSLNDEVAAIPDLISLLSDWPALERVDILPYHSYGVEKAGQLMSGYKQDVYRTPEPTIIEQFRRKLAKAGLPVADA